MSHPHRLRLALIVPALLLGACGQGAPSASTPAAPVSTPSIPASPVATPSTPASAPLPATRALSPLYVVHFEHIGQQGVKPGSSIERVLGGSLHPQQLISQQLVTQQLRDVNDGNLGLSLVGVDTFVVGSTRHIRAVYRVTNNTGQDLANLTFVPVNTDNSDPNNPSTSSPPPTVGSTYFEGLSTFGGTDASNRATDLTPVTGKQLDAAQGAAVTDPNATPYAALDTGTLNPSAPSGQVVAGRAGAGWRVPSKLASGASTNVTFAVDLQNSSPQIDPFNFSVILAAGDDNTAPTIAPASTLTPRLSLTPSSPASAPTAYVSGTLGDPGDPASTSGLDFAVSDRETAASSLTVTATSSDTTVATATLSSSSDGATRTLKIAPQGVGTANVTVTVSDGTLSSSYVVQYAASKASSTPGSTAFHTGESNASSAIALADGDTMIVADDEYNALDLYPFGTSGLPYSSFDFSPSLNLTDMAHPEMDLEASTRSGNRLYWLGSHSNNSSGNLRPNRYRLFATDLTDSGAAGMSGSSAGSTLSFVGHYDNLRSDLISWDANNGHGLGANYLGLSASAASGVAPEASNSDGSGGTGFNIEGMSMAPGSATTAFLGFRAPNLPTAARSKALIVPVTNFTSLVGSNAASAATFGAPILLDLGGRGVREIKCNASGCLILAGYAGSSSSFALYSWSGSAADPAQLRNDLTGLASDSQGSLESIVNLPAGALTTAAADGASLQLLSDNGDTVYYGSSVGTTQGTAKGLPLNWQKFRSDTVSVASAQSCTVNSVTLSPTSASTTIGGKTTFTASVNTTPANCPVAVTYASSNTGAATVNSTTGVATGAAAGTSNITASATAGYGAASVTSAASVLTVQGNPDFTLTLGTPNPQTFTTGSGGTSSASVTVNPSNGYSGTPSFTVSSSPSGVTGTVSGSGTSFAASLSVPASLAAGSYSVSVTGTDGSLSHTSNAQTITVAAAATVPNVVVYRVGDGSAALSNTGNAVFLDTFRGDTGATVKTVALPTAAKSSSSANYPLIASGTASSEGLLSRSANGSYLLLTGYGTTTGGTASLSGTASTTVPRVIGRVDASGNVNTTTALTDAANGNNPRSAASMDGTNLYITGGAGGVRSTTLGATTSTQLNTTVLNVRQVNIFGGQLYISASTGTNTYKGLSTVGSGLPTMANQTITRLPGFSDTASPSSYAFFFTTLGGGAAVDTVYVADDTTTGNGGIQKYTLSNGTWTQTGTVGAASAFRGVTGYNNGGTVTLFATSATTLVSLTDSSGFGGTLTAAPTTIATAAANTVFRGVALAPGN